MKLINMHPWIAEAVNNPEENDTLIVDIAHELAGSSPGANSVSVGGDTLIFASVESNGELDVYECTIRRVSRNVLAEERPEGAVPTRCCDPGLLS